MSNNIKRKTGLRKKIILSIFLIAIIPGLAGLLITYWEGKKGMRIHWLRLSGNSKRDGKKG